MTRTEIIELKRFAKEACKENNIKVFMKNMILLESGSGSSEIGTNYVMFKDYKTGKEYQCYWGDYNSELDTMYSVNEYIHKEVSCW